jgi:coproporphyrinogen III oxidase
MSIAIFKEYLLDLQNRITTAIGAVDGSAFVVDRWQKAEHEPLQGHGITQILENGNVFERAGCGFSHVRGSKLPPSATATRPELAGAAFEALGVSLVFHPHNPYAPTVHMNIRMLSATGPDGVPVFWFGGGMDLTPYYGFSEDAVHFHTVCRDAVAPFGPEKYALYKRNCDAYFFLKHRNEPRGIGGIFFDDFTEGGFDNGLALVKAVGDSFLSAYMPILGRRIGMKHSQKQRDFQLYRRGRYVEFNLVWDRGTHFGLQSGGRTESILMSMPPLVSWSYQYESPAGSPEADLTQHFLIHKEWI